MADGLLETTDLRGYSLCEAGPLYRLARSIGLPPGRGGLIWLGVRLLPMATFQILLLFAAVAVPVVPLVFVKYRLADVIMNVVKGILHL